MGWMQYFLKVDSIWTILENIYYTIRKTNIAIPDCFIPYLINVERMTYCSIRLETTFISEELCMKYFVVVADTEDK